jgi:hypothetical protein
MADPRSKVGIPARWSDYRRSVAPVKQSLRTKQRIFTALGARLWPGPTSILNITLLGLAKPVIFGWIKVVPGLCRL